MTHFIGKVIAGKNKGFDIADIGTKLVLRSSDVNYRCPLNNVTWSLFQAEDTTSTSYSFWKGMAGAVLFGPFGLIAGAGGKKTGKKTYLIEVIWNDTQERSLLELDEKGYKTFLHYMY